MAASLVDIIKSAELSSFVNEDGDAIVLELMPGLTEEEIREFAAKLPCPLPEDVRNLLSYTRGFTAMIADVVDFTGESNLFEYVDAFLHGIPIASDGYGNFWVVDLTSSSEVFGPVYFACHDAPVILYQCASLAEFLTELFRMCNPPHESVIDDVHEDRLYNVWRKNPGVISYSEAIASTDADVAAFAESLDNRWSLIDLRGARPGMGFSWGRYGHNTRIKRFGELPIFAYSRPLGMLQRLFGGKEAK